MNDFDGLVGVESEFFVFVDFDVLGGKIIESWCDGDEGYCVVGFFSYCNCLGIKFIKCGW